MSQSNPPGASEEARHEHKCKFAAMFKDRIDPEGTHSYHQCACGADWNDSDDSPAPSPSPTPPEQIKQEQQMSDINEKLMQAQIDNLNAQTQLIRAQARETEIRNEGTDGRKLKSNV